MGAIFLQLYWHPILNRYLYTLFEYKEDKRLSKLEKYISEPDNADPKTLKIAKEQRDTYYFKVSTGGIYAEKILRDSLISLHETTPESINWTIIRRAMHFIRLDVNGELFVRDAKFLDIVVVYYNRFVALMFGLLSIGSLFLLLFSSEPTFMTTVKMILLAIVFGVIVVLSQNFLYSAAKKISAEIQIPITEQEI